MPFGSLLAGYQFAFLSACSVRRSTSIWHWRLGRTESRATSDRFEQDVVVVLVAFGGGRVPSSLEAMVGRCHAALGEIVRGNAEPWADLFSPEPDVSLGNPFGPFVLGFDDVMSAARGAANRYRDGEVIGFDRVAAYETADLACVVEVERFRARVGDSGDLAPVSLRVTSLYRAENGGWKLAHRHADPITSPRPADSVLSANP